MKKISHNGFIKRFISMFLAILMVMPTCFAGNTSVFHPLVAKAATQSVASTKGLKVKVNNANGFDVSFAKVKKAKGYQLAYSKSKKFKKKQTKFVRINPTSKQNKKKIITYSVKNLKNGQKYYVKIRAYKKVGKKTIYGKYSSIKAVTVKKRNSVNKPEQNDTNNEDKSDSDSSSEDGSLGGSASDSNNKAQTYIEGYIPESMMDKEATFEKTNSTITYSKGQWVKMLLQENGSDVSLVDKERGYSYADVSESEYADYIQLAENIGCLPASADKDYDPENDVKMFYPNDEATREFAVYTTVHLLEFETDNIDILTFSDSEDITYPNEVSVAIRNHFLSLKDGKFNPNLALSETDKNQIFANIEKIQASEQIDETKVYENVKYSSDVKKPNVKYRAVKNGDSTFTVRLKDETSEYSVGDVLVLPASNEYPGGLAIKISSIKKDGDVYVLSAITPEFEEVYNTLQFQGVSYADVDSFEFADDVTGSVKLNGGNQTGTDAFRINEDKEFNFEDAKLSLNFSKDITDKIKINGNVDFSIPKIKARVDATVKFRNTTLNELYFTTTNKLELTGNVEATGLETGYEITHGSGTKEFKAADWELGRFSVPLGHTGLTGDVVLYAVMNVKGEITLTYKLTTESGIHYTKKSGFKRVNELVSKDKRISVKASAKLGLKLSLGLWALSAFNLAAIAINIGFGAAVSYVRHADVTPVLNCGDGVLYLYLSFGLDDGSLLAKIGEHLSFSIEKEIWNETKSPLLENVHVENANLVNKCTYGQSRLIGKAVDKKTGEPIKHAEVKVYQGNVLCHTGSTDVNGEFIVENVSVAEYNIVISATGYKRYSSKETAIKGDFYLQTYELLSKNGAEKGDLECDVLDAVTAKRIENFTFKIYKNWNVISGTAVLGGECLSGGINVSLESGYYTVVVEAKNYSKSATNVVIEGGKTTNTSVVMNSYDPKNEGTIRIILTWGEKPLDLDSHLYCVNNQKYHVFFSNEKVDNANLDVDDTNSYGPETVTITKVNSDDKFEYYVHDYTNRSSTDSDKLAKSNAVVRVYDGNNLIATFKVPTNKKGTAWHVFDYDSEQNEITPINTMDYTMHNNITNM